jgi:hypothetical protein
MSLLRCTKSSSLASQERAVFAHGLEQQGLALDIWDLFEEWVVRSTAKVEFFYLKVHDGVDLVGLGLFLRIRPFDMRTSYSRLRHSALWSRVAAGVSVLSGNCLYVSFRNLVTSNLARPFFCRETEIGDQVMEAILGWLEERDDADMVSIVDTSVHEEIYRRGGFTCFPTSSEAFFDVTRYEDVSQYLAAHRSLRKNLARRKNRVKTEIMPGPVCAPDRAQVKACVECSARLSKVNNPCQQFFEEHIFDTDVFNSDKYVHIRVRVDGVVAGFHIFQVCGTRMGGVLGGFNREYTRNNFVYERVVVASLRYAIEQGLTRVQYSLVDNRTKQRLVPSRQPCAVYFFSNNALNRKVFESTYKYSDMYDLHLLEGEEKGGR